jgi:hypothetical protein
LWLELGDTSVRLEHCDQRLLDILTAIPLPQHGSSAKSACSTVELCPCTPVEVAERAGQAAESFGPLVAGDSTHGVPPIHVYMGHDCITMALADVGFVQADPEWRQVCIGLVPERADTLTARTLAALAFQDLAAHFGYFAIHASMAERGGDGVLFCGERARGKSTSCLALGRAGWAVRCDDRCYVRAEPPSVWGPGGDMRLREDAVGIWSDLRGPLERGSPWGGKKRLALAELVAQAAPGSVRPTALFFPEVADEQGHTVAPLPAAEALQELLCATGVASIPDHTAAHFAAIADLVESAPCYRLRLARDMSALPAAIEEVLD